MEVPWGGVTSIPGGGFVVAPPGRRGGGLGRAPLKAVSDFRGNFDRGEDEKHAWQAEKAIVSGCFIFEIC